MQGRAHSPPLRFFAGIKPYGRWFKSAGSGGAIAGFFVVLERYFRLMKFSGLRLFSGDRPNHNL